MRVASGLLSWSMAAELLAFSSRHNHNIMDLCPLHTRALISCCAVARAQHLGQNSRFTQQPLRGWLRAAQHAILGAQHFSPQAKKNVARLFFAVGQKKIGVLFSYFAGGDFFS